MEILKLLYYPKQNPSIFLYEDEEKKHLHHERTFIFLTLGLLEELMNDLGWTGETWHTVMEFMG